MIYQFEKNKQRLIQVPRYNEETDRFDAVIDLPPAADVIGTHHKHN